MEDSCCDDSYKCDYSKIPEHRMYQLTKPSHKFDLEKVKKTDIKSKTHLPVLWKN